MASIRERINAQGKKSYEVTIRLRGFPVQRATFSRKTEAKKWAEATESAIREGRHFKTSQSRKHTVEELIERYKRDIIPLKARYGKNQASQLDWWKSQLGPYLLCDVTAGMVAECRDKLLNETTNRKHKRSQATVVRYLAALSHAFSVAMREWEWLNENPVAKVRRPQEPKGRTRFLDESEIKRLLSACRKSSNEFLYPVVALALSTGMRQGEILSLRWEDIDEIRKQLVVHKTKNKERRTIPITASAFEVLMSLKNPEEKARGLVFSKGGSETTVNFRKSWERAVREAAIPDFRFHDLRHTAGSYLAMNNATTLEIAEVLGHKTLQMVKRYAHLSAPHTRSVVERMNEAIFAQQEDDGDDDPVVKERGATWKSAA